MSEPEIIVGRNALCRASDLKSRLTYSAYSALCGGPGPILPGADVTLIDNRENLRSPRDCYQEALELCDTDILILMHDDVTVYAHDWADRVMEVFEKHPDCVCVGLGGATGLGTDDLYRKPYEIGQMARINYCSNQTDAETHGKRFTGVKQVAVVEQFLFAVRVKWLRMQGGFPDFLRHHMVDGWIACKAARCHKEIWMVGCDCHHAGGGSSTKSLYRTAKWLAGGSMELDHIEPHALIYAKYRDVLPIRIPEPAVPESIFRGKM